MWIFATLSILLLQERDTATVWGYRDYLPVQLAKLTPAHVEVCLPQQQRRTRRELQSQLSLADDRRLRLLCLTWNVGAGRPRPNESLEAVLDEEPSPDICCIGFQETCQLSARRLLVDGSEWSAWRDWAVRGVEEVYIGSVTPERSRALILLL
eukprot:s35_g14.t1